MELSLECRNKDSWVFILINYRYYCFKYSAILYSFYMLIYHNKIRLNKEFYTMHSVSHQGHTVVSIMHPWYHRKVIYSNCVKYINDWWCTAWLWVEWLLFLHFLSNHLILILSENKNTVHKYEKQLIFTYQHTIIVH